MEKLPQNSTALAERFYGAFQKRDGETMASLYATEATFSDPVFAELDSSEVKTMWKMLCQRGPDLQLDYSVFSADDESVFVTWTATYTFGATGRKVTNHVKSEMKVKDGQIHTHTDRFSFWRWASQAFGTPGLLLGWTPLLKNKVRKQARKSLASLQR